MRKVFDKRGKYANFNLIMTILIILTIMVTGTKMIYEYILSSDGVASNLTSIQELNRLREEVRELTESHTALTKLVNTRQLTVLSDSGKVHTSEYECLLNDSLATLSERINIINDAISPMSVTDIITLQRLGDKYTQLVLTISELKASISKAELVFERVRIEHSVQIRSEIDRYTQMMWGLMVAIVLIVIQHIWAHGKNNKE